MDVLEVIDKDPKRLEEVYGIGKGRAQSIAIAWEDQKSIANIMIFLQEKDVSPGLATKIYKRYGQESLAILNENPYKLADDMWGVGFKTADQIAQKIGFELNSIQRIRAGILFTISQATTAGHLYVELNKLKKDTCKLLEVNQNESDDLLKQALHNLHENEKIKLITKDESHHITLAKYYFSEKNVAKKTKDLVEYKSPYSFDLNKIYSSIRVKQNEFDVELNQDQQKGIMACLENKISIITGGPGTGKTTLIKKLLNILDDQKLKYKLAAPTGRAAKRIFEGTRKPAQTIHRMLEFDFSAMSFSHNERNTLQLDFLIVDEASMIDIFLANALLKAIPLNAHVIFIGDVDQLPSVGAGNFLNDLIDSKIVNTTRLIDIFRQSQGSLITLNAHRINNGEFPSSHIPGANKDFIFIKEEFPEAIPRHLQEIFRDKLKSYKIPAKETIVLTPMHRGAAGTQKINQDLQGMLNTQQNPKQIMYSGTIFKTGDPVMQIRNNYDKNVYNGDIGFIEDVDMEERELLINYDQRIVPYGFDELNEIVLAYSISIHKSQGSEYSAVIVPIFIQHFTLLQRNLIYTAITRAKRLCIFIGQTKALAIAIKNNKGVERNTFLNDFLTSDLEAR